MSTEVFETEDLALATFLDYMDHPVSFQWVRKRCLFVFSKSEMLMKFVQAYTDGSALINPREYSTALSIFRERMLQAKELAS